MDIADKISASIPNVVLARISYRPTKIIAELEKLETKYLDRTIRPENQIILIGKDRNTKRPRILCSGQVS